MPSFSVKKRMMAFALGAFLGGPSLAMADSSCGPAFNGWWDTGVMTDQGQYTRSGFMNNSVNGALHADSDTSLRLNSRGDLGSSILAISYNESYRNLSAKAISKTECQLTFGRPRVDVDEYGVAKRVIARRAILKLAGAGRMRWCWFEKGHQLGDCVLYRRDK